MFSPAVDLQSTNIKDNKFALMGITNITCGLTHTPMCVSAVYPVGKTLSKTLSKCKGRGFESHPRNMSVIFFFHRTRGESAEYTVLTHIGVWVKNKYSYQHILCLKQKYFSPSLGKILSRCFTVLTHIGLYYGSNE